MSAQFVQRDKIVAEIQWLHHLMALCMLKTPTVTSIIIDVIINARKQ